MQQYSFFSQNNTPNPNLQNKSFYYPTHRIHRIFFFIFLFLEIRKYYKSDMIFKLRRE